MVDAIHIHEDDWGMRMLHPLAALSEIEADIAVAVEAEQANRAPSGVGWTDVHVVAKPSLGYADIGLLLTDAARVLTPIFPRIRRFYATASAGMASMSDGVEARDPYGSYEEDAWCFGLHEECYLKLEAKDDLVSSIWFDFSSEDADAAQRLRDAIRAIDALAPSVIADYFLDFSGVVSDAGVLDAYFTELAQQYE